MNLKNKALEKIDEANKILSNSPYKKILIESGLSVIPIIGQAIMSSFDARASVLFEKNYKSFIEIVYELIQQIEETKLDKTFVESDEFVSILFNIIGKVSKAHEEEKIQLFANVFLNLISIRAKHKYKEGYISIIDELSVDHIRIFSEIHKRTANQPTDKQYIKADEIGFTLKIGMPFVHAYCEHLARFGLLRDWGVGRMDYEPGFYELTSYGYEFISFLKVK